MSSSIKQLVVDCLFSNSDKNLLIFACSKFLQARNLTKYSHRKIRLLYFYIFETFFLDCEKKGMITMKCLCRETCDSQGSCVEDYKFLDDDGTVSMDTYNPCQVIFN